MNQLNRLSFLWLLLHFWFSAAAWSQDSLSLDDALAQALTRNPQVGAFEERARAESAAIASSYSLTNPRIGFMREVNINAIQVGMGPMDSWMVAQELLFPTKYFLLGAAQKQRASGAHEELAQKKLEVRQEVISTYYRLYSAKRVLALLEAQKETLREIARVAEARRATGAAPQQDEMKAHVEQTLIENELIIQEQEIEVLQAKLYGLINSEKIDQVRLPEKDLPLPEITVELEKVLALAAKGSKAVAVSRFSVEEAEKNRQLAQWGFAPDLMLGFRKPFRNAPVGAYAFTVELGIPLWFLARQTSEIKEAGARSAEAERRLEQATLQLKTEVLGLIAKVKSYTKLLKIYETALIPQTTSTLNSSRAAYSAGKAGFLDLLDSERSLYQVRISYFQALSNYVENLAALEQVAGTSLSTLPFQEEF